MASFDAEVRAALVPEQQDLVDHAEHCSADPEALAGVGRARNHQVRVRIAEDPATFALYTVSSTRDEVPATVVRMGRDGSARLGRAEPFTAIVDSVVPRRGISDADAERLGEFVERLTDDGVSAGLIVIAPHGGQIEPFTDTQAERVAARLSDRGVSTWLCRGYASATLDAGRCHITSTEIHEASFPALGSLMDRGFRYAVAFHGFRGEGVLVGGGASFLLKAEIGCAVEDALAGSGVRVRIAGPDDVLAGDSPDNLVNRLTASGRGGVHLEQSAAARRDHALAIADAVSGVFTVRLRRLGRRPWPGAAALRTLRRALGDRSL